MAQSTETKLNKRFDQNIEITGTLNTVGNITVTSSTPSIILVDTDTANPNNQSIRLYHEGIDANLPDSEGLALVLDTIDATGTDLTPSLIVAGNIYAEGLNRVATRTWATSTFLQSVPSDISITTGTFSGRVKADTLELTSGTAHLTFTESGLDWSIINNYAGYNNGIVIYNGTGGVDIIYDEATIAEFDTNGVTLHQNTTINGTLSATGYNKTNWDTAYGWGNHADANYLTAVPSGYVQNTDDFFKPITEIPGSANLNSYRSTGYASQNANADASSGTNYPTSSAGILEVINDDTGNGLHTVQRYSRYSSNQVYTRYYYNGGWQSWARFLTTEDEGSGNGLDADTVDGLQASQFVRSDASDTMNGDLNMNGNDITYLKSIVLNNTEVTDHGTVSGTLAFDENFYADTEYGSTSNWNGNGGGLVIYNEDGWGRVVTDRNMGWLNASFNTAEAATSMVVTAVDPGNPTAAANSNRVSGYGMLGNRSMFYITNAGGDVQIGNGTIHNQNPTALFGATEINLLRNVNTSAEIILGGDTEHKIYKSATSLILGGTAETTVITGRQLDFYAYDKIVLRAGSGADDDIYFHSGGVERMRIEADGTIVFGDGSVDDNVPLQISYANGPASIDGQLNQTMYINSRCNGTNEGLALQTVGNTHVFLQRNGDLGIGTVSPACKLHIADATPKIRIENTFVTGDWSGITDLGTIEWYTPDTSGNAPYTTGFISNVNETGGTLPSGALVFGTTPYNNLGGAIERMRIDSDGLVGIGTDNPDSNLHIASTGDATIKIEADTDNVTETDNPTLMLVQDGGAVYTYLGIDSTNNAYLWNYYASGLKLGTGNTQRVWIDSNGNVGVGNGFTAPEALFHVRTTNVGINTIYADLIVEDVDAQIDITSNSDGSWGSALNLVEGGGASNTNIWSIARQTSGAGNALKFNFGIANEHANTTYFTMSTTGNFTASGDIYAKRYYDGNNDAYYVDPASTSVLNYINIHRLYGIDGNIEAYDHLEFQDNFNVRLGGGADFRMWHDGTSTVFRNYNHAAGNMYWQGEDLEGTNHALIYMITDVSAPYVILYANGIERLRTISGGTGGIDVTGDVIATADVVAYSDERVKENIETISGALDKVKNLRGVSYNRTDLDDKSKKIGVIAQEIQEVLPEVVLEQENGMLGVSYGNITAVLIEAVKELSNKVEELENKLNGTK